jgi:RNA polymerase sigma factor FliA
VRIIDKAPLFCDRTLMWPNKTNKAQHGTPPGIATASAEHPTTFARRDGLVLEHLRLAKSIAVSMRAKLPVHVDLDDLAQAGVIGLLDAANKFRADRQDDFSRYAKHRIKGAILDSLRQLDWASRDMRHNHRKAEAAKCSLTATLQRAPTDSEVAATLNMDVVRYRTKSMDLENMGPVSADTRVNQYDDLPAPDFAGKPDTQPDFVYAQNEMRRILGKAIKTLPERYQEIVTLYYTKELTMKEIGAVLGVNESRVSQLHNLALHKIATVLHQGGIDSGYAFQA